MTAEATVEGLYLYCFREKSKSPQTFSIKGINGEGKVFTFTYREIEAVMSKVSIDEFTSSEIQKKAQEDPNWIKDKVLIHEKVIEEAVKNNGKTLSAIPMRFGIIFKNIGSLEETLDKDYSRMREVLKRIRGKQEWGIKLYLKDKEGFEKEVSKKNEAIKKKQEQISALPEGMAYFVEGELKELMSSQMDKELNNVADFVFENITKYAVAKVKNKILEKELTGKQESMILNAAYLIPEEKVEEFKKEVGELSQKIQAERFYLEYSGPWPIYNFSSY